MNTFWLIIAGLIIVIATVILFVLLPWLRKTQNTSKGLFPILTGNKTPAVVSVVSIVLFATALYLAWSKPATKTPTVADIAQNGPMAPEHLEMIKGLQERLRQNPNDGKGWSMLGRSYAVLGRFSESAEAYDKAASLMPNDAAVLVDYADVLAMASGKNLQGKPFDLLHSALKIDPNNTKALLLSGKASYQAGDFAHAIAYFEKLQQLLPPDSLLAKQVSENIATVRAQMK